MCAGQKDLSSWEFYAYLKSNNLNKDALHWLNTYPASSNDHSMQYKVHLEKAEIFLSLRQIDSAHVQYLQIQSFQDTLTFCNALCVAFIEKDTLALQQYMFNNKSLSDNEYAASYRILKGDTCLSDTLNVNNEVLIGRLNENAHHKKKSWASATLLSVIVPGAGKWYLGFPRQARTAFIINVALGLLLAEALVLPAATAYVVFCATGSAIFYLGNVWGTALLAKKMEKDFVLQLHEDISDYYYFKLYPSR
ncbi:MAG: hypothetical protein CVU05_02915 [Bacteroidetes bacterium HGW-Bacteroidetes-21]|jgi:TM2 domain-containing membrane protein YozV|nr:MAG: hypothetical protein CVU05_02915 [Bacteroidetes bacterium HGW-Bacteroidetes-21]